MDEISVGNGLPDPDSPERPPLTKEEFQQEVGEAINNLSSRVDSVKALKGPFGIEDYRYFVNANSALHMLLMRHSAGENQSS